MTCRQIPQNQARQCGCHYCESGDNGQPSQPVVLTRLNGCDADESANTGCAVRITDWATFAASNCGVTQPDAVCGPFWFTYTANDLTYVVAPYTGLFGVMLWWNGTIWKGDWYCYVDGSDACPSGGWEYQSTTDAERTPNGCVLMIDIPQPALPCCVDCSELLCDDGEQFVDFNMSETTNLCGDVIAAAGNYTFERGAAMPAEVHAMGFVRGSCSYFWREFTYTPANPCDDYDAKIGVLVAYYRREDITAECAEEVTEPDGTTVECDPPADDDWDRAGVTRVFCFSDGVANLSYTSCCSYFECGDAYAGTALPPVGCCCQGVAVSCCEELIPTTLTLSSGATSGTITYVPESDPPSWQGLIDFPNCGPETWDLTCQPGDPPTWQLQSSITVDPLPISVDCDPLELVFPGLPCATDPGEPLVVTL